MNVASQRGAIRPAGTGKVALAIVLISETVFFATLLAAYAALRGDVVWAVAHTLQRLAIPIANTVIFLASAYWAWQIQRRATNARRSTLTQLHVLTLALGVLFIAGQIYEFSHAGLRIDDQAFGGVFFALMGFHAVHVLAGMVVLALNVVRARSAHYSRGDAEAVEIGGLFWLYVVAVWLVLFAALYLV